MVSKGAMWMGAADVLVRVDLRKVSVQGDAANSGCRLDISAAELLRDVLRHGLILVVPLRCNAGERHLTAL